MTKTLKMQVWLALALCSLVLTLGSKDRHAMANPADPPPGLVTPRQATPMPDFNLSDVSDTKIHATDLQGKVVVVRFWATW
jgi:cytochrome oxidase Cu insertion factor (SCO1/SenC/PrrC family)